MLKADGRSDLSVLVNPGPRLQQQPHAVPVPVECRGVQGVEAILGVEAGDKAGGVGQEDLHQVPVAPGQGHVDWGGALAVGDMGGGPGLQQGPCQGGKAPGAGEVQGSGPRVTGRVEVDPWRRKKSRRRKRILGNNEEGRGRNRW